MIDITPPNPIKCRTYQRSDKGACLELFRANTPAFFDPDEESEFSDFLDPLRVPFFVATNTQGGVIGCGGYYTRPETREGRLCWGMVHPNMHKHGIGSVLLQHRINAMKVLPNVDRITLDTTEASKGFFLRHGFAITAVTPDGIRPGLNMVSMSHPMTPAP